MKRCVILNPIAGAVKDLDSIRQRLDALHPARLWISEKAGEIEHLARQSVEAGFDQIVSAGGDGTLNEVVNGIASAAADIILALVPLGTGNDFARTLGVPIDIDDAIEHILQGRIREIDLVRVTSDLVRYFVNVSSGGFSGLVDEKLTPEMKKTWGPLAYLRSAAAILSQLRGYMTRVTLDDSDALEIDLYNVIVANGRYVAAGIPVAPEAEIADGLVDVILIPERGKADLVLLAAQILVGKHLSSDGIIFHRAKKVAITSKPGMWFNVDGELIGNEPATFELLPKALRCAAPAT